MISFSVKLFSILFRPYYSLRHLFHFMLRKFKFKEYHWSNSVNSLKMITPQYICLGNGVRIGANARIEGIAKWNDVVYDPIIKFCDNVAIQQDVHITCANKIVIGKNTAIAARVTITDINHPYEDVNKPIDLQDIIVDEVIIGEDCKIYNGAVILPGVHIGNHCVVGANSVVNLDIPSFSVVVGMPAKIIKKYDFEKRVWRKTDKNGNFIN